MDGKYGDRMLLAEANQWPEDAVAYFGEGRGDECHMAFHFPLMPRLFMALRMEDRTPIVDILEQTPPIPETSQWALFLRNHDELTLEMVTDEERDYMYRTYAHQNRARINLGIRRRLAPLLGNDRRRIELMHALLLSLPGTPVMYYGDEIGMGENIYLGDRDGVRTPMQWSSDKNAGFSRANPQALYLPIIHDPEYHYQAVNVEAQLRNPHSLLWWVRRLLALRKRWRALGEGACEFLHPENHTILSYLLRFNGETLLMVANLSRFVQPVELDLREFAGGRPMELFGRMDFPPIGESPYFLTLSPHSFFLFALESGGADQESVPGERVSFDGDWLALLDKGRLLFEPRLAAWLGTRSWFQTRGRRIKHATARVVARMPADHGEMALTVVQVDYVKGDSEFYHLPLGFARSGAAEEIALHHPAGILAELEASAAGGEHGVIFDAAQDPSFARALLGLLAGRRPLKGAAGDLITPRRAAAFRQVAPRGTEQDPVEIRDGRHHTMLFFGERVACKLFRRLHPGRNPDHELGEFLTVRGFAHAPKTAGALELASSDGETFTLAVANKSLAQDRRGWDFMLEALSRYYEGALAVMTDGHPAPPCPFAPGAADGLEIPEAVEDLIGSPLDWMRLLGERTADLHLALSAEKEDPRFAPEPFTPHYLRGLFQSMRNDTVRALRAMAKLAPELPRESAGPVRALLSKEQEIIARYRPLHDPGVPGHRIRCHGFLTLRQVRYTGRDFLFTDFEGAPWAPTSERSIKHSPFRDVSSMMRSFHYAAWEGLSHQVRHGALEPDNRANLEPWAALWQQATQLAFLVAYLERMKAAGDLPQSAQELRVMLPAYLLHEMFREASSHLSGRLELLRLPVESALNLLKDGA